MRPSILSVLVLSVVAVATAGLSYYCTTKADPACCAARDGDALQWMKAEFHLNDAQYAAIAKAHEEQSAMCAQHCQAVAVAREHVEMCRVAGDVTVVSRAQAETKKLEDACQSSVEAHVRRVAALMPVGEGDRYLAMVLPRLNSLSHSAPPDLRLGP